jgi:hypothetical protein
MPMPLAISRYSIRLGITMFPLSEFYPTNTQYFPVDIEARFTSASVTGDPNYIGRIGEEYNFP